MRSLKIVKTWDPIWDGHVTTDDDAGRQVQTASMGHLELLIVSAIRVLGLE
jgi:hypothetical protein